MPPASADAPHELRALVDRVYAAAVEPAEWSSFLRDFGAATESDVVPFLVWDYANRDGQCLRVHPLDESTISEYLTWSPHNPYVRQSPRLRTGEIRIIEPSEPEIRSSAFYNEWLRPKLGVGHNLAMTVFSDATMSVQLSPLRDPRRPAYGRREARILRSLGPHVRRALTIEQKLASTELVRLGATAALDAVHAAVFFLDSRGRVVFFNRAARALVDQRDGLVLERAGVLAPARPSDHARFKALVAAACATGTGRGLDAGGALRVSRTSDRRPFQVIVTPLPHRPALLAPFAPCAIVFAAEPDRLPTSDAALRELFDLTPAEARIARLLGEGHRVTEIAETLALREATIRTHVKRLLEKTDSRTQADLMRVLCAIPAQRRSSE